MLERILDRASTALLILGGVAVTLMMLQIGADIIGKYFFNTPILATLEIVAWYYMVATIFFPIAYVQLHRKHLMVELFTQWLPPRKMAVVEVLTSILTFVYVGTLFVLSFRTAIDETARGEAQDATFFDLPVWPSRWILPVSLAVMALVIVMQALQYLNFAISGRGKLPGQAEQVTEA